jgi:sec-independent protein translocase protein TatB
MLSIPHMIVVFIVVLVVFGPHKLPELARGLGKLMAEFRKASTDFKSAFEQEMRDIERQTMLAERKKAADAAASAAAATQQSPAAAATLATPAGTDTRLADGAFGPATEGVGATDSSAPNDTRAMEALVVTPVAEAVARGTEGNALETSNNGVSHVAAPENTIDNPHRIAAPQEGSTAATVAANNPAHDTQQPA